VKVSDSLRARTVDLLRRVTDSVREDGVTETAKSALEKIGDD